MLRLGLWKPVRLGPALSVARMSVPRAVADFRVLQCGVWQFGCDFAPRVVPRVIELVEFGVQTLLCFVLQKVIDLAHLVAGELLTADWFGAVCRDFYSVRFFALVADQA